MKSPQSLMGMNRDFALATEDGVAPAPQLSERNSALQLFQIEPCEEVSGVVAVNGVKLPALLGNGFPPVDLEPG